MKEEEYVEKLNKLLIESIKKNVKDKDVEMAFSGGLDSSVLAKFLVNLGYNVRGYVAGVKGSRDIKQARNSAREIGIKFEIIELGENEIEESIGIQGKIIKKVYDSINDEIKIKNDNLTPNAIPVSFNLPLYFVAKNAKTNRVIVSQGPDEMLGGYTRHQKLDEPSALEEMRRNTEDFLKYGVRQNLETARYWKKEFIMPYLDSEIVNFCLNLPYDLRINKDIRKYLLRKLALKIGISEEIAFREKKAAQYGSGILDVMKKLAKKQGHHISWLVREKVDS